MLEQCEEWVEEIGGSAGGSSQGYGEAGEGEKTSELGLLLVNILSKDIYEGF